MVIESGYWRMWRLEKVEIGENGDWRKWRFSYLINLIIKSC